MNLSKTYIELKKITNNQTPSVLMSLEMNAEGVFFEVTIIEIDDIELYEKIVDGKELMKLGKKEYGRYIASVVDSDREKIIVNKDGDVFVKKPN